MPSEHAWWKKKLKTTRPLLQHFSRSRNPFQPFPGRTSRAENLRENCSHDESINNDKSGATRDISAEEIISTIFRFASRQFSTSPSRGLKNDAAWTFIHIVLRSPHHQSRHDEAAAAEAADVRPSISCRDDESVAPLTSSHAYFKLSALPLNMRKHSTFQWVWMAFKERMMYTPPRFLPMWAAKQKGTNAKSFLCC